jgi:phage terminase large subunit-like protein
MKTIALVLISVLLFTVAAFAELDMKSVDSSLLDKVGYDNATQTLVIQMLNSSDIYTYRNVPQTLYDELLAADSKGTFFVKKIKGKYERGGK